eukprot:gene27277-biopygen8009
MNSCHGVRDRNRAGIEAADLPVLISCLLYLFLFALNPDLTPPFPHLEMSFTVHFLDMHADLRDHYLPFQLDSGHKHPPCDISASENGHRYSRIVVRKGRSYG